MILFGDIHTVQLNRVGEELCGDQVRTFTGPEKTRIVLSDGLGSGVKANILATLTAEIIIRMLREDAALRDVVETIAATLPACKERGLAYATFSVLELERETGRFRTINFDNPPALFFHNGKWQDLPGRVEEISGRKITIQSGRFTQGDFLALITDGVIAASAGATLNQAWSLPKIAEFIENLFVYHPSSARSLVQASMGRTRELYGSSPADDASMVGLFLRESRRAVVFTGPPMNKTLDDVLAERVATFDGQRIVCGGTTAKIMSFYLGENIETDLSTSREDVPPMAALEGIDLVTEGILTMSKALELMEKARGDANRLPADRNGAVLLAQALLGADEITFLVGQNVNPYYQNPALPASVSIRRNLVENICSLLMFYNKHVSVEYF